MPINNDVLSLVLAQSRD